MALCLLLAGSSQPLAMMPQQGGQGGWQAQQGQPDQQAQQGQTAQQKGPGWNPAQPAPSAPCQQPGGGPYQKGGDGKSRRAFVADWRGKGAPTGSHGGGASAYFRQNMMNLKEVHAPEMGYVEYMNRLSLFAAHLTGVAKDPVMETNRQHLQRHLAQGKVENSLATCTSAMKRPAALKRPAAKDESSKRARTEPGGDGTEPGGNGTEPGEDGSEEVVELTAAALKDHNQFCEEAKNMSVKQFEAALVKLDGKASMRLWKAFENSRKSEGLDGNYKLATGEGVGSLKKKRQLLLGWVADGSKCAESFKTILDSVSLKKAEGVNTAWLTKAQAVAHWGVEELKERVKAGTVRARVKSSGVSAKAKAEKKNVLDMMAAHNLEQLTEGDFELGVDGEEEEDSEDELPPGLAAGLGEKAKKKKEKVQKEDKWEALSQVQEGEGAKKLSDRLMAFKTELTKDLATLEAALHSGKSQAPKSLVKDVEMAVKEGQVALAAVTKCLKDGAKKAMAATALQNALAAVKGLKSKKTNMLTHNDAVI
eukprot:s308_g63.t1